MIWFLLLSVLDEYGQTKATQAKFPPLRRTWLTKIKRQQHFHRTESWLCVPEEWRGASWGVFSKPVPPRCHLHPRQAARAAQGSELRWAAMARLNVPGSSALRASSHTQPNTQKHTLGRELHVCLCQGRATSSKLFKCSTWLCPPCLTWPG